FYTVIKAVEDKFGKGGKGNAEIDNTFNKDMDEDFNTALALSELFKIFKTVSSKLAANDKSAAEDIYQVRKTYSLLGIFKRNADDYLNEVALKNPVEIPDEVLKLAEERWQAKKSRDFARADALRGEIENAGYIIKDSKDNYMVIKK
ncbi:MAG: hypothetical protein K2K80_01445, partial [Clostridia bacterium]|nr:hypothetical protein [Clostridia bacterium]